MIDVENGNITMDNNSFVIRKGLTKDEFKKSELFEEVLNEQVHTFTNYYLKPQLLGEESFSISLFFDSNEIINFLQISMIKDGIPSWDNWSEKQEQRRKAEHDQWLKMNIGKPPYKYSWGEISSNYDPRSGSSMITIRYSS